MLLTPVVRRRFDSQGRVQDSHGVYTDIVREVAAAQRVACVDLHRKSWQALERFGVEESKRLFLQLAAGAHANYPQGVKDNTHFSPRGAELMAALAVEGIREQKLGLAKYLKRAPGSR